MEKRVFLIVLDSFGIGAEPDAAAFGDEGTNTLGAIANHPNFNCPNLKKLGLFNIPPSATGRSPVSSAPSRCPPSRTASRTASSTSSRKRPATKSSATSLTPARRC